MLIQRIRDKIGIVKEYSRYVYESVIDNFPQQLDRELIEKRYNQIISIEVDDRITAEEEEEARAEEDDQ